MVIILLSLLSQQEVLNFCLVWMFMENFRKLETANNELQNFEPRFKNSSQHLVWLGFFSTEVSFFLYSNIYYMTIRIGINYRNKLLTQRRKCSLMKKKETLIYSAHIPSFSICLDQVWDILFPNILFKKKRKLADQRKTFISVTSRNIKDLYWSDKV